VRLATAHLHQALLDALGEVVLASSDIRRKPIELDLGAPLYLRARAYVYTLTHPPGGRTVGEHKIQLIAPGQKKGRRANFDHSGGRIVLLIGWQPELSLFALWDAGLYRHFPHSRNVQIKAETLYEAYASGIATQVRKIWSQWSSEQGEWSGDEVVVAALPGRLVEAIGVRLRLSLRRILEESDE
jgi:hypothetical protein